MAAGSTYTPIATTTLGSAAASYTFSSIPSTYTDLILVFSGTNNQAVNTADYTLRFNSDSGTNYSRTAAMGNGSTTNSVRGSNQTSLFLTYWGAPSTTQTTIITNILNYANTTTYKTVTTRNANSASGTDITAGLWRSTSAINTILITNTVGTFSSGSTFTLYGIAAA
jgi:hypothetical protein